MNTSELGPSRFDPRRRSGRWQLLSVTEWAALLFGYLYVTGYYIDSVFLGNLGIQARELFRLDYIRIGFVFTMLVLCCSVLPAGTFIFTYNVRTARKLPHLHAGAVGNSLNTILALGFLVFIAVFVTRFEFDLNLPSPFLGIRTFKAAVGIDVAMFIFGMAILPGIERLVMRLPNGGARWVWLLIIEPIRYGVLLGGVAILVASLSQLDWVWRLAETGFFFLSVAGFLGIIVAGIWVRTVRQAVLSWMVLGLIGFGVMTLYFFAVTSYVLGAYTYIPVNRGGRLPLTEAHLKLREPISGLPIGSPWSKNQLVGPVYIVEEDNGLLYVASMGMDQWTTGFVPLHVIRTDNVEYRQLDRITNGYPRTIIREGH